MAGRNSAPQLQRWPESHFPFLPTWLGDELVTCETRHEIVAPSLELLKSIDPSARESPLFRSRNDESAIYAWWSGPILIATLTSVLLAQAWFRSIYFDGFFANGAFELFNPLRRLSAGQRVGEDFHAFHGIGTVLSHYPIFAVFGGDFRASETARYFPSPFLFAMSTLLLFWMATRSLAHASLATVLAFGLAIPLLRDLLNPANALLGVRSTLPVVAAAMLLLRNERLRLVSFSVVLGASIVVSTEQGLAAIAAALALGCVLALMRRSFGLLAAAAIAPLIALALFFL